MIGGPALAAAAALRAGAGLAKLAMPAPILNAALTITPEATGIALPLTADAAKHSEATATLTHAAQSADALLIGPGLGQSKPATELTRAALETPTDNKPPALILDADALNNLTTLNPDQLPKRHPTQPLLLTPHLGEYKRLTRWLNLDDPHAIAERLGAILIIKSATTTIADARRTLDIPGKQPLLATGGTGDILAGIITGLLAQKVADPQGPLSSITPFDLAAIAVRAHQHAASRWAAAHTTHPAHPPTRGMLAADLLPFIAHTLEVTQDLP